MFNNGTLYDKAKGYCLLGVNHKCVYSMCILGLIYEKSNVPELALKYYSMSAENGNIDGMYKTVYIYHNKKEYKKAKPYITKAINKGFNLDDIEIPWVDMYYFYGILNMEKIQKEIQ